MSRSQRKYAADYRITDELDASGRLRSRARYVGVRYVPAEEAGLRRVKPAYVAAAVLTVVLYVLAGLTDTPALGGVQDAAVYVVMPYVLLLLPAGMVCARAVTFALTRGSMERIRYDRCVTGLRGYTWAYLVLAAASALGMGVWMCLNAAAWADWRFLLLCVCMAALAGAFLRVQRGVEFREEKPE